MEPLAKVETLIQEIPLSTTDNDGSVDDEQKDDIIASSLVYESFNSVVNSIYNSDLVKSLNGFVVDICYIMAEMIVEQHKIKINSNTMLINQSKKDFPSDDTTNYGIKNLFKRKGTFCSDDDSGNCVDILIDLKYEYTITQFHAWTPKWFYFTCPVTHAYLWVFGTKLSENVDDIKALCQAKLYSKTKFENIKTIETNIVVLDPVTRERKRDEMIPVALIKLMKSGQKGKVKIPSHVKGRYVMIKLVSDTKMFRDASNVDVQYICLDGYKMKMK